ncbi:MAG: aspartyl protease family protein, partial [Gemmataceae bacterium]
RKKRRRVVDQVEVELLGRRGTFKAIVEPARADALIGAIVLEDLDLLVDCRTQTLQPRDPKQIIAEIE